MEFWLLLQDKWVSDEALLPRTSSIPKTHRQLWLCKHPWRHTSLKKRSRKCIFKTTRRLCVCVAFVPSITILHKVCSPSVSNAISLSFGGFWRVWRLRPSWRLSKLLVENVVGVSTELPLAARPLTLSDACRQHAHTLHLDFSNAWDTMLCPEGAQTKAVKPKSVIKHATQQRFQTF